MSELDTEKLSFLDLPFDILTNILKNLTMSDLFNLMLTCKKLKEIIVRDSSLWRHLSRHKLIVQNSSDNRLVRFMHYYHKCRISHNWCKGIYKSQVAIYYDGNYMPWLYYDAESLHLAVGTELRCYATDRKGCPLRRPLWTVEVPTVRRNDIRTNDVSRFAMKNGLVACGNRDGCVAIYRQERNYLPRLIHHIRDCHENGMVEVSAVEIIAERDGWCVVSASYASPTLCMWGLRSDAPRYNGFANHPDVPVIESRRRIRTSGNTGIICLAVNFMEDMLAMGLNGNSKPILLDITTGEMLLTADETKSRSQAVRDIRWHNENTIVYVTHSGHLHMLDTRTGLTVYDAMDPFMSTLYCVKSDGDNAIVVGSCEFSRCVLFDARYQASHVQMYFTQRKASPVYCLDFDSSKLIAAADRSIALLNFNVNPARAKIRDYSHAFELINYVR